MKRGARWLVALLALVVLGAFMARAIVALNRSAGPVSPSPSSPRASSNTVRR